LVSPSAIALVFAPQPDEHSVGRMSAVAGVFLVAAAVIPVQLALAQAPVRQPILHWKTREIRSARSTFVNFINSPVRGARGHLVLQFAQPPDAAVRTALAGRGVAVLGEVPENGLLVSLSARANVTGLGVLYAERIEGADKVSPVIGQSAGTAFYLAEF